MPGTKTILAAVALTLAAAPGIADEKAIGARKAQMQLYSFNIAALGAMAKGQVDYDAEAASAAAGNLLALTKLNATTMWPQGSDSTAMPGKTRAKLEAWTTFPAIVENNKQMIAAAEGLAGAAGNGLDALRGAMGPVGQACGACHKAYRDEKK